MPDKKLPADLRFKLEMVAFEHDEKVRGYSVSEVVYKLLKKNLTPDEKKIVQEVCEFHGWEMKKGR